MKNIRLISLVGALLLFLLNVQCDKDILYPDELAKQEALSKSSKKVTSPDGESAGNNLSYPVIWTDGAAIALRGERWLAPKTDGVYYFVWGVDPIDPQAPLFSCLPNTSGDACEDGSTPWGSDPYWKSFIQKDPLNEWQAFNYNGMNDGLWEIDAIDWGDNLESVDWTLNSQVRTEVVLYEAIPEGLIFDPGTDPYQNEYAMRHAFGWGQTEVHGLQTNLDNSLVDEPLGNPATVYTPNARLTIQKINVESLDELPANSELTWDPVENGWVGDGLFNPPLFNMAVYEGGDGPGYYNAEVNVKGKIIFGYTWNVKRMNEDVGYYRITFSFDDFGPNGLNTEINETTQIIRPVEEELLAAIAAEDEGGDTGGGYPEIDPINKLTYIDIMIRKNRGAGGGNGGGKDRNPGGGDGGGKDGNMGNGSGSGGSGSGSGSGNGNH